MPNSAHPIPTAHTGIDYVEFLSELSQKRRVKRYLEIGVETGALMSVIHADVAIGIDPTFKLNANVCRNKRALHLFHCTSDEAFADAGITAQLRHPDLAFLDGYHTFEYLLRDFLNVEKHSSTRTLVALHDALPLDDIMIIRRLDEWQGRTAGTPYEGWWTGDVWKVVAILKKYRPDLEIVCVDCPPTGIVFVTNLDPAHVGLDVDYLRIVKEFAEMGNGRAELDAFYASVTMARSADVLHEFDNTLYFRT